MSNDDKKVLLRGRKKVTIKKSSDYISVRTKRGTPPETVTRSMDCQLDKHIAQQNISVFNVNPNRRESLLEEMKQQYDVVYAANVFQMENDPDGQLFLTDELTIQFESGTSAQVITELGNQFGIEYVKQVKGLVDCFVFKVAEGNDLDTVDTTNALIERPEVAWCEPNVVVKQQAYYTPSESLYDEQWHLFHNGGINLEDGAHVDAEKAWDITRGNRSIIVAVADDGFDLAHPDLSGQNKIVGAYDFFSQDFDPIPDDPQENHGTSVAGVAVGEENGAGVLGIAPGCSLMPIRTSGFLDDNSVEALFEYVMESGAAVMNNSWGPSAINFPLSLRQSNAVARCAQKGRNGKGVMIFFAAGNSNRPINGIINEQGWPNGELSGPTQWLDGFATHPDVIAVAACTSLNTKSFYSSWGDEISVCAPSNNGHPGIGFSFTFPYVRGSFPGRGIVTTDRLGAAGYDSSSDYTFNFGGTSSAAPLAAGVGALILSANPNLTVVEARQILESTTDKIEDSSTDPQLGFSFGTYDENGHSKWFGFGKVNAFKAVSAAIGNDTGNQGEQEETEGRLQFISMPNAEIPDNNRLGLTDTITINQSGALDNLTVVVNIEHSYIGDLRVTLISPRGERFVLHDRTGASKVNLNQKYDAFNVTSLSALKGAEIKGQWQLEVLDLARLDVGMLVDWRLDFSVNQSDFIELVDESGITIPDADPEGITRTIVVDRSGEITGIAVDIDISHTYVSDLVVRLIAPNGLSILLHNRTGGSTDNLIRSFTLEDNLGLDKLIGIDALGTWTIAIQDLAFRDVGKLNRWGLNIELANGGSAV